MQCRTKHQLAAIQFGSTPNTAPTDDQSDRMYFRITVIDPSKQYDIFVHLMLIIYEEEPPPVGSGGVFSYFLVMGQDQTESVVSDRVSFGVHEYTCKFIHALRYTSMHMCRACFDLAKMTTPSDDRVTIVSGRLWSFLSNTSDSHGRRHRITCLHRIHTKPMQKNCNRLVPSPPASCGG